MDLKDIWDIDLREIKIDKNKLKYYASKYMINDARLYTGRICTKEEFEQDKKRILCKKLP